jgi:autotransporter-associated beta strand protein
MILWGVLTDEDPHRRLAICSCLVASVTPTTASNMKRIHSTRPHAAHRPSSSCKVSRAICGALATALIVGAATSTFAADYYWDFDGDGTADLGGSGTWDHLNLFWREGSSVGALSAWPIVGENNDAFLQGTAGIIDLAANISVNDISVSPSNGAVYTIENNFLNNSIRFNGARPSVIDVGASSILQGTANTAWMADAGFTKAGLGSLVIIGNYNITGNIKLNAGNTETGISTLRANHVTLAADALYTKANGLASTMGALDGAGTILLSNGAFLQTTLTNGSFSGSITTSGAYSLRGRAGTTQVFDGNVIGMTGVKTIFTRATLKLTGAADTINGAWESGAISLRDGTLLLDNGSGNTSAVGGRIPDSAGVNFFGGGGTLSLIGSANGTVETAGQLTAQSGPVKLRVAHNGGSGGTELRFSNAASLAGQTSTTFDFIGTGGTLGSPDANPRIFFATTPNQNTVNGMLARSASGANNASTGWAIVNGSNWAGYSAANGVFALTDTSRDSDTLSLAGNFELTQFTPSTITTALSGNLRSGADPLGALKITPTIAGQSLDMSVFSIFSTALMLAGSHDFTINATMGVFGGGTNTTAYVWVVDPAATLTYGGSFVGGGVELTKAGEGFLWATNPAPNFPTTTSTNIQNGVLRTSVAALTATNVRVNFRGTGVLEISGGGTYAPTLGAGNDAGGTVNFGTSADNTLGNGGFSAFSEDATVTIRVAGNPTTLTWEGANFLRAGYAFTFGSVQSDHILTLTNDIALAGASHVAREFRVTDNPNSTGDATRLSGGISGNVRETDFLKTGNGILQLTGFSTFIGNTLVHQGTLQIGASGGSAGVGDGFLMSTSKVIVDPDATLLFGGTTGSNNRLNDNGSVILAGGTLDTGGLQEGDIFFPGMGSLTLTANSVLDFSGVNGLLHFADSRSNAWSSDTAEFQLSIYNWSIGDAPDRLFFGFGNTALTVEQLDQIRFYADNGTTFLGTGGWAGADGEVIVVVPEPSAAILLMGCAGLLGFTRTRRFSRTIDK